MAFHDLYYQVDRPHVSLLNGIAEMMKEDIVSYGAIRSGPVQYGPIKSHEQAKIGTVLLDCIKSRGTLFVPWYHKSPKSILVP